MTVLPKVSAVIPTFYPTAEFSVLLDKIIKNRHISGSLVVDSTPGSPDKKLWQNMGAEVVSIEQKHFSHGKTREKFRKYFATEYTLFLTQDVVLEDNEFLEKLLNAVKEGSAAAYARQLPANNADFFASFDRQFNYPPVPRLQKKGEDIIAGRLYFCSNSCALWDNTVLDSVGGFPSAEHNEDMLAAAKLINAGYTIAYVAEATIRHSHNLNTWQTFKRFLKIGSELRNHKNVFVNIKGNNRQGLHYIYMLLSQTIFQKPYLLPSALLMILAKFLGYNFGKAGII